MGIKHAVRDINDALANRQEPNVYVKFFDHELPQRIVEVKSQHGAVKVRTLSDYKWKFLDDRDEVYSMR